MPPQHWCNEHFFKSSKNFKQNGSRKEARCKECAHAHAAQLLIAWENEACRRNVPCEEGLGSAQNQGVCSLCIQQRQN